MRRTELKRKTPMRAKALPRRNNRRQRKADARNFGEEAKLVRGMPCLCAAMLAVTNWQVVDVESCVGKVRAAHVTARGMGAVKGGRFDVVPLCDRHHEEAGEADSVDAVEFAKTITDEQLGHWYEAPDGKQWSVDAMGCLVELSPVGRDAFAVRRGETKRSAFEKRYGLDLRAEADRIAVEHPEPLGIRGLARRFADGLADCAEAVRIVDGGEPPSLADVLGYCFEDYEREALLGWVRRRMAELTRWPGGAAQTGQGWERITVVRLLAFELGDADPNILWTLCEEAGWPS